MQTDQVRLFRLVKMAPNRILNEVPPRVLEAREKALAFVRGRYGEQEPPPDLAWKEENTTPGWPDEPVPGWSEYRFTSDDGAGAWVVTVGHPVLPPEQTVYEVTAGNQATGFEWSGTVDADGQVADASEPVPDLQELAGGNNAFAFDLYQALREEEGNFFFSPYSISQALAMTYAGARDETEQEMADTLHVRLSQERLHPAFHALALVLAGRGEGAEGMDGQGFRLNKVDPPSVRSDSASASKLVKGRPCRC